MGGGGAGEVGQGGEGEGGRKEKSRGGRRRYVCNSMNGVMQTWLRHKWGGFVVWVENAPDGVRKDRHLCSHTGKMVSESPENYESLRLWGGVGG